jgi:hypothetical protein
MKCVNCGTTKEDNPWGQWWHCRNYFGISGTFCPKCYIHIAHNCDRKPNHPELYAKVKEKLSHDTK